MKTYIITFRCALSNEIKAVEIENCTTEINAKQSAFKKYGKALIVLGVEKIEQSIEYFQS
jgi:hypothetical protein